MYFSAFDNRKAMQIIEFLSVFILFSFFVFKYPAVLRLAEVCLIYYFKIQTSLDFVIFLSPT
jgi:hypothetical protein